MICSLWNRLRLNLWALILATSEIWLRSEDVAESYDRDWLVHQQSTTDQLHGMLPEYFSDANKILELGCGSGYSTNCLREQYCCASLKTVDISPDMIEKARQRLSDHENNVEFYCEDMLDFLKKQIPNEFDLIFSGWDIGYSNPAAIVAESARILKRGGGLAIIVNQLNTMPAVFNLFRQVMKRFPETLEKAVWPRFPRNKIAMTTLLKKHGFDIEHIEDGVASVEYPSRDRLDWLLGTGVLAGFDTVLPLRKAGPVRNWFSAELDKTETGWEHHYTLFVAGKRRMP